MRYVRKIFCQTSYYSRKTKISEGAVRFVYGAADTKRAVATKEINDEALAKRIFSNKLVKK